MKWERERFSISDESSRLDVDFIVELLQSTYGAAGRPSKTIEQAIESSLCFGLYALDQQVGFARVVTDGCTFSWICDVIVAPDYRRQGLGTGWCMCDGASHREATMQLLGTRDAHGLYEKFGFARREMMIKRP